MENEYVTLSLIILFTVFVILGLFSLSNHTINEEFNCNNNITNINDLLKISKCVEEELKYEITPDNQPLQTSLLKGKGDCYDRSRYLQLILNNNNITNSIQICNVVGTNNRALHARNLVFMNNACLIVDTTILINNNPIIRPCNYRPDYCV